MEVATVNYGEIWVLPLLLGEGYSGFLLLLLLGQVWKGLSDRVRMHGHGGRGLSNGDRGLGNGGRLYGLGGDGGLSDGGRLYGHGGGEIVDMGRMGLIDDDICSGVWLPHVFRGRAADGEEVI